jgi:NifU-like protein involved in Fe-S cluster formation
MNQPLYTTEILRLAAFLPPFEPLPDASGAAEKRSATCGSVIRSEVLLDGEGRIVKLRQRVNACAFGQASAALTQGAVVGRSRDELQALRVDLADWLDGAGEAGVFAPLEPTRSRTARHSAMLLPLDAVIAAVEASRHSREGGSSTPEAMVVMEGAEMDARLRGNDEKR